MKKVQFQVIPVIVEETTTEITDTPQEPTFFKREPSMSPKEGKAPSPKKETKETDYTEEDITIIEITIRNTFQNSIPQEKTDIRQRVSMYTKKEDEMKKYISAIGVLEEFEQHCCDEFPQLMHMIHKMDREIRHKSYSMFQDVFFNEHWEMFQDWFHRSYTDLSEEEEDDEEVEYDDDTDWLE